MEQTIAFLREGVAQCSCCQTPGCNKKSVPVVAIVGPGKSSSTIAVQNLLQVSSSILLLEYSRRSSVSPKSATPPPPPTCRTRNSSATSSGWSPPTTGRPRPLPVSSTTTTGHTLPSSTRPGTTGRRASSRWRRFWDNPSPTSVWRIRRRSRVWPERQNTNRWAVAYILHGHLQVLRNLDSQKARPQVVVCFCEGQTIRNFFQAQKEMKRNSSLFRSFQWIGSDGWADRNDVVEGLEEEAEGAFSIRIHSPKVDSFRQYYTALNPENNTVNPWFREFWQHKVDPFSHLDEPVPVRVSVCRVQRGQEQREHPDLHGERGHVLRL